MERYEADSDRSDETAPTEARLFAKLVRGEPIPPIVNPEARSRAKREELERLAQFSPWHVEESSRIKSAEAEARRERESLQWAARISTRAEEKLRALQQQEAKQREAWRRAEAFYETYLADVTEWNPNQPRVPAGSPQVGQWGKGGGGGFLDNVIRRNHIVADLTGVVTPSMVGSSRLAAQLQATAKLPAEVTAAAAAGLATGSKAVVNGLATAVKGVATLGLSTSQLELIGVTKEDREGGYDTAVSIATASGQILIAVGTGGITSALSKGGSIAQAANGALIAYDTAGNAVGVVQGIYDAGKNGVSIHSGVQIAGGLLGLGANAKAMTDLGRAVNARQLKEIEDYVAKLPKRPTPKTSAANQYEIKQTGPYNYTVSGGGAKFNIDGYRGSTILEAKYAGSPKSSPYVPGSSCPKNVRDEVANDIREQLQKIRTVIHSGATPFTSVEIVTNSPESKKFFEGLLKGSGVPGTVRITP